VLLVANPSPEHVGAHLLGAAESAGIELVLADLREAWAGPAWLRRLSYRLARKRPPRLGAFSRHVLAMCQREKPEALLCTGIAPILSTTLRRVRSLGVRTLNYLTDDPWNRANGAGFFWSALREYDVVFSPRRANLDDLSRHGCRDVRYLPFAYNPTVHVPAHATTQQERERFECDVAFVGGGDTDRVELVKALLASGLRTQLYGGYWDRFVATRAASRGFVHGRELGLAVAGGKVNICMGRAANRDGHAMRSFELPAMRACLLVEDTAEHRTIFGADDECVCYYRTPVELVECARALCEDPARRERLASAVHRRIRTGAHTYESRLRDMVAT